MKKIIFQLHKILGLVTGVIVFIVAITGCCWTFREEIESLYDDYKKVVPQNKTIITATEAKTLAKMVFPKNMVHGTLFKKRDDAIEVIFYDVEPEFYQSVFLNPYSGKVIQIDNHLSGFFSFNLKGHTRLWLPAGIGEHVVGISVLIFLFISISGVILWFPKKYKNIKKRLKFDWKKTTRWKRKNFDLHSIIGFYIFFLAFIIAFTGAVMSYTWLNDVYYKTIGGDKISYFMIPKNKNKIDEKTVLPIDKLIPKLKRENPNAKSFEIHYPHNKEESIYVEVENSEGLHYDVDYRFFDQKNLEEIEISSIYGKYNTAKTSDTILRMNYDIHIGAIGGIIGKVIAFLISLLTASLPVTGILLWYGRTYKKKKVSDNQVKI